MEPRTSATSADSAPAGLVPPRFSLVCLIVLVAMALTSLGEAASTTDEPPQVPTASEREVRGEARTSLDHPEPTATQLARRQRSLARLEALGVPYLSTLPVTEREDSIAPRGARELADRAVAVAISAVKGETNDPALARVLVEQHDAADLFSPEEKAFMDDPSPDRQRLIDHAWRYEALHVLLWALGFLDELKPANEICDVRREVGIVRDHGREGLTASARPRSVAELLEQADLYYHLHWSAIELRLRGEKSPSLDEGIIRERHRALNWLIRYMNQEWDDVRTDT